MINPLIAQIGFILLTLISYYFLIKVLQTALKKSSFPDDKKKKVLVITVLALTGWTTFISILSSVGFFSDFSSFPPRLGIVLIVPLITILLVTFSKTAKALLPLIPTTALIKIQSFRVAVEILLWMLFIQNLLPIQLTFEGRNFDVLAGLTAPIIAMLINRYSLPRKWIILWNIAGLALLFNIVGLALLSLPTPFRYFMNEPANTIVATFPYVWLPGLLVPLAYGLHFLSLRQQALR